MGILTFVVFFLNTQVIFFVSFEEVLVRDL